MVASGGEPHDEPAGRPGDGPGTDFEGALLRRVPRQARSREKVARALAAAERLLERDGATALTVTGVAREAGLTVGALHQYLPDREAMTRALLTRYHARFERLLGRLVAEAEAARSGRGAGSGAGRGVGSGSGAADELAGLDAVVAAFADLHRRSAGVRALGGDRPDTDPETRAHKRRMADLVVRLLGAQGLLPGPPDERSLLVARTVFATADALMHEAFREDADGDPRVLAELNRMLAAYLSGVSADENAR